MIQFFKFLNEKQKQRENRNREGATGCSKKQSAILDTFSQLNHLDAKVNQLENVKYFAQAFQYALAITHKSVQMSSLFIYKYIHGCVAL
jgi:hypothetical protein